MHPVLLIDELFDHILEQCSDWSAADYRQTLCRVARCCKAWQDPALDRLWSRLDGVRPLLQVLRGSTDMIGEGVVGIDRSNESETVDLSRFNWYARRVKQIKHSELVEVSSSLQRLVQLPNLKRVEFSYSGCTTSSCWAVSQAVRHVIINIGYVENFDGYVRKKLVSSIESRRFAVAHVLEELLVDATPLQTLHIRGNASEHLLRLVSSFKTLTSLSLRAGNWYLGDQFATIATALPSLRQLSVDAHRIDAYSVLKAVARPATPLFPSLQILTISATTSLLTALIPLFTPNVLHSLSIDADCPDGPLSLAPVFNCLATQFPNSLRDLAIEYYPEYLDDPSIAYTEWFTISILRPLAGLKDLRLFKVTATKLPLLGDKDMDEISTWWRNLECLDLGTRDDPADKTCGMTPGVYATLARSCRMLKMLRIPVEIPSVSDDTLNSPVSPVTMSAGTKQVRALQTIEHPLEHLDVGVLPDAPGAASVFLLFVNLLFPSLTKLEYPRDSGSSDQYHSLVNPVALLKYLHIILPDAVTLP